MFRCLALRELSLLHLSLQIVHQGHKYYLAYHAVFA